MVGPVEDGKFYCLSREHGYCDRRSGTCFCNIGYQGVSCQECSSTHYPEGGLCYPKLVSRHKLPWHLKGLYMFHPKVLHGCVL